ncbi:hypothetical protein LTR84_005345 [Exophiala bonariae]|uniref:Alpha/beta hydrolase fold-3 domain-containing protein n=1 Tax=Exophiala bonariae TaxID=1690606 RepID=A0AAV9N7Q2_9EURO|nr:hypothetical protein LTR84_005345 [Exophiala bonariae]
MAKPRGTTSTRSIDHDSTTGTPPNKSTKSNIMERASLFKRIKFFFQAWALKTLMASMFKMMRLTGASKFKPLLPEYTKRYPERPMLQHRVFLPGKQAENGERPPLLISIHGGGFVICDPQVDDHINQHFAQTHNMLVISINYRLAPTHPYPTPLHDISSTILSILSDPTLTPLYNPARVSLIGFSAGGNLVLSVAQLPSLKDKIHSLVPFYPVVDFTDKYKGPYIRTRDGKPDMLEGLAPLFNWAYISPGVDRSDKLLSPIYADREDIPQRVFFVVAELDMLAFEAGKMARLLAGVDDGEVLLQDEWERNGVRWRKVSDVVHSWTHIPLKGEEEVARLKGLDGLYKDVADWLRD